jgi:biotin carboxyl carrier protein
MTSEKKLHTLPDGKAYSVLVERAGGGYRVRCTSPRFEASVDGGGERRFWSVVTQTGSYEAKVHRDDGKILVEVEGERFTFALDAGIAGVEASTRTPARAEVKAPMPGKIVKLLVAAGDTVVSGQGIVLFEAMKMQNEIQSPQDGVVAEIAVAEGEAVEARDPLFVIQPSI